MTLETICIRELSPQSSPVPVGEFTIPQGISLFYVVGEREESLIRYLGERSAALLRRVLGEFPHPFTEAVKTPRQWELLSATWTLVLEQHTDSVITEIDQPTLFRDSLLARLGILEPVIHAFQNHGELVCPKCNSSIQSLNLRTELQSTKKGVVAFCVPVTELARNDSGILLRDYLEMLGDPLLIDDGKIVRGETLSTEMNQTLGELSKARRDLRVVLKSFSTPMNSGELELLESEMNALVDRGIALTMYYFKSRESEAELLGAWGNIRQCTNCGNIIDSTSSVNVECAECNGTLEPGCKSCHGAGIRGAKTLSGKSLQDMPYLTFNELSTWFESLPATVEAGALLAKKSRQAIEFGFGDYAARHALPWFSPGELVRYRLLNLAASGFSSGLGIIDRLLDKFPEDEVKKYCTVLAENVSPDLQLMIATARSDLTAGTKFPYVFPPKGAGKSPKLSKREDLQFTSFRIRGIAPVVDVEVSFPLQALTTIRGPSGSGKTAILRDGIFRQFKSQKKSEQIFAAADYVGPLSNLTALRGKRMLADELSLYDLIVALLLRKRGSRLGGLTKESFSLTKSPFLCPHCAGSGEVRTGSGRKPCEYCSGKRFVGLPLTVRVGEHDIGSLLMLSIEELISLFDSETEILARLNAMNKIGLGHLTLGNELSSLSVGERSRLMMVDAVFRTSGKKNDGERLLLLDDALFGLHESEQHMVVEFLRGVVSEGWTVVASDPGQVLSDMSEHIIELVIETDTKAGRTVRKTVVAAFHK